MSGKNTVSSDEKALDVAVARDFKFRHACGVYVDVVDGQEQPHECAPITAERVGAAWEEGYGFGRRELQTEVANLTTARDRARSVAVALEQELARKDQALDEIRARAQAALDTICVPYSLTEFDRGHIARDLRTILRILSDLAAALDAHLNKEDDGED